MPLGPAFSVLRNRTAVVEELRRLLPKMEGVRKVAPIPFGLAAIDSYLPQGGLAGGALHEMVPEQDMLAAALGFVVALLARLAPVRTFFFVIPGYGLRRYGRLYGHGAITGHQNIRLVNRKEACSMLCQLSDASANSYALGICHPR